jgi:hypothetical protein
MIVRYCCSSAVRSGGFRRAVEATATRREACLEPAVAHLVAGGLVADGHAAQEPIGYPVDHLGERYQWMAE